VLDDLWTSPMLVICLEHSFNLTIPDQEERELCLRCNIPFSSLQRHSASFNLLTDHDWATTLGCTLSVIVYQTPDGLRRRAFDRNHEFTGRLC